MLRRLFATASVLSLVVCIAFTFLWVRSYHYVDALAFQRGWKRVVAISVRGHASFTIVSHTGTIPSQVEYSVSNQTKSGVYRLNTVTYFGQQGRCCRVAVAPDWAIVGGTAVPPIVWLLVRRRSATPGGAGFAVGPNPSPKAAGETQTRRAIANEPN